MGELKRLRSEQRSCARCWSQTWCAQALRCCCHLSQRECSSVRSLIGLQCRVEGKAVIGEDVAIKAELCIRGGIILPHKGIKDSIYEPGKIVM